MTYVRVRGHEMTGWIFHPPGDLADFHDVQDWHNLMVTLTLGIVTDLVAEALDKKPEDVSSDDIERLRPRLAYVDPVVSPPPPNATTTPISAWGAFPQRVERLTPWASLAPLPDDPDGRWRAADHHGLEDYQDPPTFIDQHGQPLESTLLETRDRQDEYLEWTVRRDADGKMIRAIFVAEGYDYFAALFDSQPETVVDLYRELAEDNSITIDDLRAPGGVFVKTNTGQETVAKVGGFNPRNRSNIEPGIVHLSHRANSLSAEVNLAGVSALIRHGVGSTQAIDDADAEKLLCCSRGGEPNRNSDPLISQQAYRLALANHRYTLSDPIGLYIAGVAEQRIRLPDGTTPVPREWWTVVRGNGLWTNASRVLRLEFSIPRNEHLTLNDLLIDGLPIRYPGQLASLLSMHLFVTIWPDLNAQPLDAVRCQGTCCQKDNSELLMSSQGTCQPGWTLRFPGLVEPPALQPPAASLATERGRTVGADASPVHRLRRRLR